MNITRNLGTTSRRKAKRNPTSMRSVENGIEILEYALAQNISVTQACYEYGRGKNYVSDIARNLEENYEVRNINRPTYRSFKRAFKKYKSENASS